MILDDDKIVQSSIEQVELTHEIVKQLGWCTIYDCYEETSFKHKQAYRKGVKILLRNFHTYSSNYYTLWWFDNGHFYSCPVKNLYELNENVKKLKES